MLRPTVSEILAAHPPQPALTLLTPRQGLLMSTALIIISIVLMHRIADGPALAVWATALLVISAALPCLPSVATAVGMTGIAMLATQAWPLPHALGTLEMVGMGLIGLLAFGTGHALARLHRLRMKIISRNAKLSLKSAVLEYLVEQHGDGIALLDGDGRVLAHNERYRDLLGIVAQDTVVGLPWLNGVDQVSHTALSTALDRALQIGAARCQTHIARRACDIDLRSLSQRNAVTALVVCTLRAQSAHESQAMVAAGLIPFANVAETRGEGFIACDVNWRIVTANTHARKAAAENGALEVDGQFLWHSFDWIPPSWCETTSQRIKQDRPGCRDLFDDTNQRWYEISFFPWREGIALVYRDITIEKNNAERSSEMTARWNLVRTHHHLGEWGFDLERSEFLFCATARRWLGLAPDCERISKQQLLERVDENDRLTLVQGIIELASAPLALLNLEVRVHAQGTARDELRLHWLGRLAEGQRQARLFGTLQRIS